MMVTLEGKKQKKRREEKRREGKGREAKGEGNLSELESHQQGTCTSVMSRSATYSFFLSCICQTTSNIDYLLYVLYIYIYICNDRRKHYINIYEN